MLDDLRKNADENDFFDDIEDDYDYGYKSRTSSRSKLFLGMTPMQRLVIAVMILLMACVMGLFLLFVTEKVYFPFVI